MEDYLSLVPGDLPTAKLHGFLLGIAAPRPIAFASTINSEGIPNLAPFSFYNIFSSNPPVLIFAPNRRVRDNTSKDTIDNLREVPEVVINAVNFDIVEQMNLASTEYPKGVDEFVKAGFTKLASDIVKPFRVAESPAQLECKVMEIKPLSNEGGGGQLVICRIVKVHIHKNVLDKDGSINFTKMDLVARMGKDFYSRTIGDAVFEVLKPSGNHNIGMDGLPHSIRNSEIFSGNDLGKLGLAKVFPDPIEIKLFAEAEKDGILNGISNQDAAQRKAKEFLLKNDIETAWKILSVFP